MSEQQEQPTIDGTPGDDGRYLVKVNVTKGPDKGKMFQVDLYDLIDDIGYRNTAQMQAMKKIMRGGRKGKPWALDMKEAIESLQRSIQREATK